MELKLFLSTLPEYSTTPLTRLGFLYSVLETRKESNPTGFKSAINWWSILLSNLTRKSLLNQHCLIVSVNQSFRESLRWEKIGRPASLGTIITELANSNEFIKMDNYLNSQNSTTSILSSVLLKPIRWSFGYIKASLSSSETFETMEENRWNSIQGDWVIKELVQEAATGLIGHLKELHVDELSRLYTIETFQESVGKLCLEGVELSERDCVVLVHLLQQKGQCVVKDNLIKFNSPFESTPPSPITTSDIGIFSILTTIRRLTAQITEISNSILSEKEKITKFYAKKENILIKSCLIRIKQLNVLQEKRVQSRISLGEILFNIETAIGDEATMKAIKLGTTTLRTLISSPTLSLDSIEETTSLLADTLADAKEINETINQPLIELNSISISEEEIEIELAEMIQQESEKKALEVEKREEERLRIAERSEVERKVEEDLRVDLVSERLAAMGYGGETVARQMQREAVLD